MPLCKDKLIFFLKEPFSNFIAFFFWALQYTCMKWLFKKLQQEKKKKKTLQLTLLGKSTLKICFIWISI